MAAANPHAVKALVTAFDNDSQPMREAASAALVKLGPTAVPTLIEGLKSPHLYERAWAVETLSRIKPLPDDAARELKIALVDQSAIIQNEAADAIKGVTVDAGDAIREQHWMTGDMGLPQVGDDEYNLFELDQNPQNPRRYTKAEIIAPIPPDSNHEYPAVLEYLVPIVTSHSSATDAKFLVTVHSAKDGEDRLAVWTKTGPDQYEAIIGPTGAGPDSSFDEPVVSSSKVLVKGDGNDHYETALFLDLPLVQGRGGDDAKFAVDHDQLQPVRSESQGDELNGTIKVIKEMHYNAQSKVWQVNWKMVPDTANSSPTPE